MFWIGKDEVTFAQFDRFCEETGYYLQRYDGIDQPLAKVSPSPETDAAVPVLPIGIPAWN